MVGGDGDDALSGDGDANTLAGGDGDDILTGLGGDDELFGEDGNDTLLADPGGDVLEGGNGVDTVDYSPEPNSIVVDPEPGQVFDDGPLGDLDAVLDDVENVRGGSGDDELRGTGAANTLIGNGGGDTLDGLAGDDILSGGLGRDELFGAEGDDDLRGGDDLDTLEGEEGADVLEAGPGGGPLLGGGGNDELLGGAGDDDLFGGGGNDELLAGAGDDALVGDEGDDTLDGGLGADVPIDGGAGADTLFYGDRTRNLSVDPEPGGLFAPADDGEGGEGDQVLDTVENVTGGSGDDTLTGTGAANTLLGNDGGDVLNGLGGADVLEGGFGADTLLSQDGGIRDEVFCGPSFDAVAADSVDNVSGDCESVTFPVLPPQPPTPPGVNTPPGTNVSVRPTDSTTLAQPVTVTFSAVTVPGQTSLVTSPAGPLPPAGFQLGTPPRQYEITTTAQFTPPVTVCIDTTGVTFPGGQPRLFHFENGAWRDVTTSVGPGAQVCGVVSSLSPFAAFAPKRAAKVVRCVVPNVRGKTLPAARKALKKAHCGVGRVRRAHSKVSAGRVIRQSPKPRAKLKRNAKVSLIVSRGRRR